jgi:hypothetical protein
MKSSLKVDICWYNLFHHKELITWKALFGVSVSVRLVLGLGVAVYGTGPFDVLELIGRPFTTVTLGHESLDRCVSPFLRPGASTPWPPCWGIWYSWTQSWRGFLSIASIVREIRKIRLLMPITGGGFLQYLGDLVWDRWYMAFPRVLRSSAVTLALCPVFIARVTLLVVAGLRNRAPGGFAGLWCK